MDKNGDPDVELPLARVDYMLRAAVIPAGTHALAMVFVPDSVHKGNVLSMICFALMLLTLGGTIGWEVYRRKKAVKVQ